jgi:precorrin-6Y C5,15-methyltransferase (decarboxylating)
MILWDLGAGSGSVGIEASVLLGRGRIEAVEKNPDRADQIRANARRFGVANLKVHQMDLPRGLASLPDPDRVFVGGGGKDLPAILAHATGRLPQGGIVVANLVVLQNLDAALACCGALNLETEVIQLQVNRGRSLAGAGDRLEALNPVWLITGKKS